jgi:hypothetical protein
LIANDVNNKEKFTVNAAEVFAEASASPAVVEDGPDTV